MFLSLASRDVIERLPVPGSWKRAFAGHCYRFDSPYSPEECVRLLNARLSGKLSRPFDGWAEGGHYALNQGGPGSSCTAVGRVVASASGSVVQCRVAMSHHILVAVVLCVTVGIGIPLAICLKRLGAGQTAFEELAWPAFFLGFGLVLLSLLHIQIASSTRSTKPLSQIAVTLAGSEPSIVNARYCEIL